MSRDYNYNSPQGNNRRGSHRRRQRRIIIRAAALILLIGAATFLGIHFFNNGKNNPAEVLPTPTQNATAKPPAVSSDPRPSGGSVSTSPVETTKPTSTPQPTTPAPSAPTAATGTISLEKAAKPLWIKVTIAKQNVTVYDANNQVVQSYVCSTGIDGEDTETPVGTYKVAERGESFFSETYQQGAYYWTQFYGDYLFHSVPFDKNRVMETAEAAKLGTKASHGCVRLTLENAKWIYDNIPRGTVVVIQ